MKCTYKWSCKRSRPANQWPNDTGKSAISNLTREEERLFDILFKQADTKGDGIVTGEVAITLFFKTKLSENILGEVGYGAQAHQAMDG